MGEHLVNERPPVSFRPALFWDVDPEAIDWEAHADWVIARVLSRGTLDEVQRCVGRYGRGRVQQVAAHSRTIPPAVGRFWLRFAFEEVWGVHADVLPPQTQGLLPRLVALLEANGFLLCGGTALALRLGHRYSDDLDFLTQESFDAAALARKIAGDFPEATDLEWAPETVHAVIDGVKTSFIRQKGLRLTAEGEIAGVPLADLKTLAILKLNALAGRGERKDFIDLYALGLTGSSVADLYRLGEAQLPQLAPAHLLRSMVHFEDAEHSPMPKMIAPWSWDEVRRFFERGVRELLRTVGIREDPLPRGAKSPDDLG